MPTVVVPAPANSVTIPNLVDGQVYSVTVTARNAVGSGPSSTVVTGTPAPPQTSTFLRPFAAYQASSPLAGSMWYRPVAAAISGAAQVSGAAASYGFADGSAAAGSGVAVNKFQVPSNGGDAGFDLCYIYHSDSVNNAGRTLLDIGGFGARSPSSGTATNKVVYLPASLYVQGSGGNGDETANARGGILSTDSTTWFMYGSFSADPGNTGVTLISAYTNPWPNQAQTGRGTTSGSGGSGLSSVGGVIRPGELEGTPATAGPTGPTTTPSINHAIVFTFPMGLYGRQDAPPTIGGSQKGGAGFTTPAVNPDGGFTDVTQGNFYGGSLCWMGSLLAIRPQDYTAARAAMSTNQGRNLVDALTVFGGYIVDDAAGAGPARNGQNYNIVMVGFDNAGIGSAYNGTSQGAYRTDLGNILPWLYVILGNDPPV